MLGDGHGYGGLWRPRQICKNFRRAFFWLPNRDFLDVSIKEALAPRIKQVSRPVVTNRTDLTWLPAYNIPLEQRLKPLLSRFIVNSVEYVCLTGGLFLNCQVTGKIRQWFPHLKGYSCRLPRTTADSACTPHSVEINATTARRRARGWNVDLVPKSERGAS